MEKVENQYCKIWIENNICFVEFLATNLTEEIVSEIIKSRISVTGDKNYVMVSDMRLVKSVDREARKRIAEKDASTGTIAVGLIFKTKLQITIFNFFSIINKPPKPVKLFTKIEDAIIWLENYKNCENEN